jgi:hypothetical protein
MEVNLNNTCRFVGLQEGPPTPSVQGEVLVECSVGTLASALSPYLLYCHCLFGGPNNQKDSFVPDDLLRDGEGVALHTLAVVATCCGCCRSFACCDGWLLSLRSIVRLMRRLVCCCGGSDDGDEAVVAVVAVGLSRWALLLLTLPRVSC